MLGCKNLALATFRSAVIFVKYRKVSTCTILPNFIDLSAETAKLRQMQAVDPARILIFAMQA